MVSFSTEESELFTQRQALIAAARAGDARAQCRLGDVYRIGDELTAQDFAEALRWYRLAAEQGDAGAQNNLGAMYQNALGVACDPTEAAKWYREAAIQGLDVAEYNMAICYLNGAGVEQSDDLAIALLHHAAEQGYPLAIGEMGSMFRFGRSVKQDLVVAARLHSAAASYGVVSAAAHLQEYRPEIEREALAGSLRAALWLAKVYDDGLGVEKDAVVAFSWLLIGKQFGSRDDDEVARNELYEHTLTVYSELSSDERAEAYRLVEVMCGPSTRSDTKGTGS